MAKVKYNVGIEVDVTEASEGHVQVVGREIISGINTSIDQNVNVEDLKVTDINGTVQYTVNCMPEEEINELSQ